MQRRTRKAARGPAAVAVVRTHVPREVRRQQILDAAAELFARRGFVGTTTKQIAEAVGTSETVLFRLFPTKESLYAEILEHRVPLADVERWLEELRNIADRRDDDALFGAFVKAVLRSYRTDATFHRLMLFAALENHALARLGHVKYTSPVASFLREYVSRRQAEGAFKRIRPELVVHMLFSVVGYYAQWNMLGINPLGLGEQEVASATGALLAALRAEPAAAAARAAPAAAARRRRKDRESRK
jgi:AcrR family transcriptional regulator